MKCRAPCKYQKKLRCQPLPTSTVAAVADRSKIRFYILDAVSNRRLMVDTGCMQSTFLPSVADLVRAPSSDTLLLISANGSPIRYYETRVLKISIMGQFYSWPFAITDVRHSLLGTDILAHHGLLVNVAGKRLINTVTCRNCPLRAGPVITPISTVVVQPYAALLQEFPDVFKPELRQSMGFPSKHGVYHHINMTGPPTHAKFRRLPPQKLRNAKRAFEDMERRGICMKPSSPWASPLHMVKKLDGTWRPCGSCVPRGSA
ncbi:uncharacterized protein [Palaemon carinicauda]|uniref:uncharacterized protein n=1 Tax=Palaemon carinicauda TaxID=392227 RepID=UPI0035B68E40